MMKWLMGQQYLSGAFGIGPAVDESRPRKLKRLFAGDEGGLGGAAEPAMADAEGAGMAVCVPSCEPLPPPASCCALTHFRIFMRTPFGSPMSLKSWSELIITTSKSMSCICVCWLVGWLVGWLVRFQRAIDWGKQRWVRGRNNHGGRR